jgi:hypothetical protein
MEIVANFASTKGGQIAIFVILFFVYIYYIVAMSVAVDLANSVGNESVSKQNATRVSGALGLFLATAGVGLTIAGVSLAAMPAPEVQVRKPAQQKAA